MRGVTRYALTQRDVSKFLILCKRKPTPTPKLSLRSAENIDLRSQNDPGTCPAALCFRTVRFAPLYRPAAMTRSAQGLTPSIAACYGLETPGRSHQHTTRRGAGKMASRSLSQIQCCKDKDESMSRESRVERQKKWRKAAAQPALPHACRLAGHQKTSLGPFLSGAEQPLSPISCANPNATEKSGTCRPNRTTYPSCTQHPCLTQRNICRVRIGAVTPAALQSLSRRSQLRSMRIAPCED